MSTIPETVEIPDAAGIRAIRERLGLTQAECAALAALPDRRRWNEYERGSGPQARRPSAATWRLFLLRAGLDPEFRLVRRRPGAPDPSTPGVKAA